MDVLTRMRTDWEQRAQEDPLHYIATDQRELDDFAESGRKDAQVILGGLTCGGSVLEIGAGIGRLLVAMEDRFDDLVGVDISPRMIELSHDYLASHPKVRVLLNDGSTLPVEDGRFDVVFSYIALQHVPERRVVEGYIAEAHRVLKPGGTFRFQVIHRSPRQTVLRPFGLAKPTTWQGYNWTARTLAQALRDSPFGTGQVERRGPHIWATTGKR
jgi:ubiquinone/menaquinone biosynthesis C-methylase UbiE